MDKRITRRRFAISTLAAGTAAVATRSVLAGFPANERIRVAVIGCRNRGNQVAANLNSTGRCEVVALCDCDAAMLGVAMGKLEGKLPKKPRAERDFRKVLDDQGIDAVVNATPDHWHAMITVLALEAGKHVYVEKPASYNIEDGRAMVAAQRKHPDLTVLVGTQQRSAQHFNDAKAFIAGGGLGKVAFARAWLMIDRGVLPLVPDAAPPASLDYDMWLGPAPYRPYNEKRVHYNWHFMKDYGTGDLGNWGAHWLDTVRYLLALDVPKSVSALGGAWVSRDAREWPDTQTVLYEFAELTVLWELRQWTRFLVNGMANGAELAGEKGTLIIDRGGWTFQPRKGEAEKHLGSEMEHAHAVNFADCVAGSAQPAASIEEGHKTSVMIHLGNMATTLGRRLEFDPAAETIKNDPEANRNLGRAYREPWKLPAWARSVSS